MRTYEIFLKRDGQEEYRHAGSIDAPDDELALLLARENYLRRAEGDLLWMVDRQPPLIGDRDFVAPNSDKPHRDNDGLLVAAHRKSQRESR